MTRDTTDRIASGAAALLEAALLCIFVAAIGYALTGDPSRGALGALFAVTASASYRRMRLAREVRESVAVIRKTLGR